ncbi:MAG: efflux RND transporter periplasmic adaptor subunit, partial [Proteobacteria bacterium]
ILSTGLVKPENKLEIKPPIAGRVESVLVKEGAKVRKGQTLAWMSSTERAAMLDAATARGPEELKKWEELYRPTPILAPINGTIIQRNVESGQTFATNDAVLVMSDRLTIKAQVDETDLAQIKLGQKATIGLDAYAGDQIRGTVDQIAYDATTVNNVTTYVVDVLPDSTPPHMRSGMTANVTFVVNAREDVLTVPADAIKVEEGKMVILVEDPQTKQPVKRVVQVGATDGKKTEILEGLKEGEPVMVVSFSGLGERKANAANPFMGGPPNRAKKKK